jgi:hypothetical protein
MTALQELEHAAHHGELLYGYEAIGEYLGMTPREVRHQAEANGLPLFNLGRRVAARVRALRHWLDEQEQKPRSTKKEPEPVRVPLRRARYRR